MKGRALLRALKSGLIAKGPQIATGVGIGLALIAGIQAVKKTPEAVKRIEEKKEELKKDELTVVETVQATWKCYLPAIIIFLIACALIIGGQRVSTRRAVAAATACSIWENKATQYDEAARELFGDKKADEIRTQMARNEVTSNPPTNDDDIVRTGRGNALFYDELSKRYFWSDPAYVDKVFITLNFKLLDEMYVSLSDYWEALGLPATNPGKLICWRADDGKIDPSTEVIEVPSGPYQGYPCKVIGFYNEPEYSYKDRY